MTYPVVGASDPGNWARLARSANVPSDAVTAMESHVRRVATDPPLRRALRPRGPVQFGISERTQSDATVLHVDGELDILTAPKLSAELDVIIRRYAGDVVIDLSDALFIDSAGLHILLSAHRRLTRASRRMTVICGDGPVRRVIELARLTDTLGVVPDGHDQV